jgi:hypothetical protein
MVQVPWRRLRPGATVLGQDGRDHKVVVVEHRGHVVGVLFWDGIRELHDENARARVKLDRPAE